MRVRLKARVGMRVGPREARVRDGGGDGRWQGRFEHATSRTRWDAAGAGGLVWVSMAGSSLSAHPSARLDPKRSGTSATARSGRRSSRTSRGRSMPSRVGAHDELSQLSGYGKPLMRGLREIRVSSWAGSERRHASTCFACAGASGPSLLAADAPASPEQPEYHATQSKTPCATWSGLLAHGTNVPDCIAARE